jgi:hypothetical protein
MVVSKELNIPLLEERVKVGGIFLRRKLRPIRAKKRG